MKLRTVLIGFVSIIVVALLPIAMDHLLFGNDFGSYLTNGEWAGFLGGYIGALIGAIVSLVGIRLTIKHANEQNKRDRELQVHPYCKIELKKYWPDSEQEGYLQDKINIIYGSTTQEECESSQIPILVINNIGLGPVIDVKLELLPIIYTNDPVTAIKPNSDWKSENKTILRIDGISIGETIRIFINADFFLDMEKHIVPEKDDTIVYPIAHQKIVFSYSDILQNHYEQTIVFKLEAVAEKDDLMKRYFGKGYISLEGVSTPIRIDSRKKLLS